MQSMNYSVFFSCVLHLVFELQCTYGTLMFAIYMNASLAYLV